MIPFASAPPPQPATQVQVVQTTARPCAQIALPGSGGKPEGPSNRQARRAYQACVLRSLRRRHFSKAARVVTPAAASLRACRAEVRGMI
jgi:hypothetical protein